jgi:hypothetical protein
LDQGLCRHPEKQFVILHPGFQVGDQSVEQVVPGLVEVAEMGPPGYVAHGRDPGFPQFGCHRAILNDFPKNLTI